MSKNKFLLVIIVLLVGGIGYLLALKKVPVFGQATPGLASTISSSSAIHVGRLDLEGSASGGRLVFATSTPCTHRVISTKADPILIHFGVATPTPENGHLQAASTTVSYDSGLYGCGAMRIISAGSPTTIITVTQFQ